jgi:alpha-glucosidase
VPGVGLGRDGCRTPMQWDDTAHAGFSTHEPWLPLSDIFGEENAMAQQRDDRSIYRLYRRLIALRRERRALALGRYRPIVAAGDLLLFIRELDRERILVALNFGGDPLAASLPSVSGTLLLSTLGDRVDEPVQGDIDLRPHEGVVVELSAESTLP